MYIMYVLFKYLFSYLFIYVYIYTHMRRNLWTMEALESKGLWSSQVIADVLNFHAAGP